MVSLILSTIAFFVASYYLKRYLEDMDIPKGMTRSVLIFSIALLISYLVAMAADYFPHSR
jgi:hypothetical protein